MNVDGWKCLRNGIKCADKQKRWRKVWRFPYLPLPLHWIINKGIIMENLGTSLNPVQLHLLEMFNYCGTEETMEELRRLLASYYAEKAQKEADRLWDEGILDGDAIEQILDEHLRTSSLPLK